MSTGAAPSGYRLVRMIGSGGGGVVWEAVQQSTERPVALKLLDVDTANGDLRRRFEREGRVMATLAAHPNVVTVLDAGVYDGGAWLAMELCRRGSLAAHLSERGSMPLREVLETLVAVAGALQAAHDRGILHCDVKPANILLTDFGAPAVGDFGIARVVHNPTTTASVAFTLDHVAPELLDGGVHSVASDVYSLGTTTWQLLTGWSPFRRGGEVSAAVVMHRILTEPLPDMSAGLPQGVDDLLRAMTAKDPARRPDTMAAVAHRAAALLAEAASGRPLRRADPDETAPPRPTGPATVVPPATPARRPGRRPAALVGAGALLAVGAAGWLLWPATQTTAPGALPASTVMTESPVASVADTPGPPVAAPAPAPGTNAGGVRAPVRVYNNSPIPGLASRAATDFRASGWLVTEVGTFTDGVVPTSTVYFRPGTDEETAAQELGREFGLRVEPRFAGIGSATPGLIVVVTSAYSPPGAGN